MAYREFAAVEGDGKGTAAACIFETLGEWLPRAPRNFTVWCIPFFTLSVTLCWFLTILHPSPWNQFAPRPEYDLISFDDSIVSVVIYRVVFFFLFPIQLL